LLDLPVQLIDGQVQQVCFGGELGQIFQPARLEQFAGALVAQQRQLIVFAHQVGQRRKIAGGKDLWILGLDRLEDRRRVASSLVGVPAINQRGETRLIGCDFVVERGHCLSAKLLVTPTQVVPMFGMPTRPKAHNLRWT